LSIGLDDQHVAVIEPVVQLPKACGAALDFDGTINVKDW
jgi:hypothetical protein